MDREGCECEEFDLGIRDIVVEELETVPGEFDGTLQPVDRRKASHATEINLPA